VGIFVKKFTFCMVFIIVLSLMGGLLGCSSPRSTSAPASTPVTPGPTTTSTPASPALENYNRGYTLFGEGKYEEAIAEYNKAIEIDPSYAQAYNNRGDAYDNKGQYDLAIADYNKAIELDPNRGLFYYNRGFAYSKKGRRDLAISDLNKAIELSSDPELTQDAREMIESLERVTLDVPTLVSTPDEAIMCSFTWEYGEIDWEWEAEISQQLYQTLHDKPRPRTGEHANYSVYVTHSLDDVFFQKLASTLSAEGGKLGYTNYQMVELATFFVRTIPYSYDIDSTGRKEYPRYPIETLVDGTGDCEDHAILLAELIRSMNYDAILLAYPTHMALGVVDTGNMYGTSYTHNGKKYYYVETTPSGRVIGDIPEEFKCPAYTWELVPVPLLGCEGWRWPAFTGTLPLELTIYNDGTAPALGVTAWAKLDAGNNTHWAQTQVTLDIPPEETRTATLNLKAPNQRVSTRVVYRISYGGFKVDEGSSDWFEIR